MSASVGCRREGGNERQFGWELKSPEVENKAEQRSKSQGRSYLTSGEFASKPPWSPEVSEGTCAGLRGRGLRGGRGHDTSGLEVRASTRVRQVHRCELKEALMGPRSCQPRE